MTRQWAEMLEAKALNEFLKSSLAANYTELWPHL